MQATIKRKGWKHRLMILLFIPMLVSCASPSASPISSLIWKVAAFIGRELITTTTGQVIEQLVDKALGNKFFADTVSPPKTEDVIPDQNDLLHGYYSKPFKWELTTPSGEKKSCSIQKPKVIRPSKSSGWEWDIPYSEKRRLEQCLKRIN